MRMTEPVFPDDEPDRGHHSTAAAAGVDAASLPGGGASTPATSAAATSFTRFPWWFDVGLIAGTAAMTYGLPVWAQDSIPKSVAAVMIAAMVGLAGTLIGSGWGAAVAFAEGTKQGLWFALFPPYMIWFSLTRWSRMRQPTVVFLCGLTLALGVTLLLRSTLRFGVG